VIIEPPAGSRLAKKKFINGRWMSAKKFRQRRARGRRLHECERAVTVVGAVSDAVVEKMRMAGVAIIRRSG
jgi:hypothetical protein